MLTDHQVFSSLAEYLDLVSFSPMTSLEDSAIKMRVMMIQQASCTSSRRESVPIKVEINRIFFTQVV